MILSIVLRKVVNDTTEAQTLYEFVKDKLQQYPDVTVTANVSESLELPPPPS